MTIVICSQRRNILVVVILQLWDVRIGKRKIGWLKTQWADAVKKVTQGQWSRTSGQKLVGMNTLTQHP